MNFQSIIGNMRKKNLASARRKARRATRLNIESLETREVPATLPAPVIDPTSYRLLTGAPVQDTGNGPTGLGGALAPGVAANPLNPQRLFSAHARYFDAARTNTEISFEYSTNGGKAWAQFQPLPINGAVQSTTGIVTVMDTDPKTSDPTVPVFNPFTIISSPSVAFDSFNNVYVAFTESLADGTSGEVVFLKFNFTNNPTLVQKKVLYAWTDTDEAYNAVVAVDTNRASFNDGGITQTDALAAAETNINEVRVFVAWNTRTIAPQNVTINPNVIKMAFSDNGGAAFAPPVIMNADRHDPAGGRYTQPQMVFTQGRAGQASSGGRMITSMTDMSATTRILTDSHLFTAANTPQAVEASITNPVFINDAVAPPSGDHIPADTFLDFNLTGQLGGLTQINNMSVTLNLNHDDLNQVLIELLAPGVAPGNGYVLFFNGLTAGGVDTNQGIDGTALGILKGFQVGTTFQDNAIRSIRDASTSSPRLGTFRAEDTRTFNQAFGGLSQAQINGLWRIHIRDFRDSGNPDPQNFVRSATLRLSQNYRDSQDPDNDIGAAGGNAAAHGTVNGLAYPTASAASPTGIGPSVTMAVDNTLGAFSPFQNRLYLTYDTGGGVRLKFSDDGGLTWSAQPTSVPSSGTAFLPKIALDPTTGTVGVAYYSTGWGQAGDAVTGDAAGVRTAMMFTTSVNGPDFRVAGAPLGTLEFAAPAFVNPTEQYFDQIRTKVQVFEPVTSNGPGMGSAGYGNNIGLFMYGGRVNLLYGGNLNEQGAFVRTQNMTIAGGPRVVSGDMGPILGAASAGGFTYNNTFAADGHRQFDGFLVTFDRVVDPNTFTSADVNIKFVSPTDNPVTGGTFIPANQIIVTPLDNFIDPVNLTNYGSKRFLVRLTTPQSAVGTYSYSINGDISDRIRSRTLQYVNDDGSTQTFTQDPNPDATIPDAVGITPGVVNSDLTVNMPGTGVVGKLAVRVHITHLDVSELQLDLRSPSGQVIRLVNAGDATPGANFTNTIFEDDAALTLADDVPPYSDPNGYQPAARLGQLDANAINGTWRLIVTDTVSGNEGTLDNWSLTVTPANLVTTDSDGNLHDQDSDGVGGEGVQDSFAMPNPVNGVPFVLPYASGSLPIVVSGPYVVATQVQGQPPSNDNVVLNATASAIDVQFDRIMDSSTFTRVPDVLRITGPLGDIPLNGVTVVPITGLNGAVTTGNSRFFRITFPTQKLSGAYRIQLGSGIADTAGNLMDTNNNAGVGNLSGGSVGAPVDNKSYGGTQLSVPLPANATTTVNLSIADAYALQRARATISLILNAPNPDPSHTANTANLEARLQSPTGTSVLLFLDAPQSGFATTMINTTFDDGATTPVQEGGTFDNASFNPISPLAQLNGQASQGTWKLVIKNKGSVDGEIQGFKLQFDKPRTGTGLGEDVADQSSIGFRIFQMDGSSDVARGNWTPVGPAGHGLDDTMGRVQSVAVDPTDVSGNTVYVAGASGGVWRTTNFLTRDPDGPNWVPLTDFGPTNAINVGALALFPDPNGDPLKTTVLVGTGSQDANRIQQREMLGREDLRFDGVGFLLSEDAGKTWQVLDSTNNFDSVTGIYRPISDAARDHRFVGAVVNKLVFETNKNEFAPFRPIIYAVVGRGTAAAGTEGLWRSEDGGRTWNQLFVGAANDFVVAENSRLPNSGQRPTLGFLAIEGDGIYRTVQLNSATPTFTKMDGGVGRPNIFNTDTGGNTAVINTNAPADVPNGGKGKIVLAAPALVPGDPLANNYYELWLYALVIRADGTFDGLYQTKDAGDNWTLIVPPPNPPPNPNVFFSFFQGNSSSALAVDPTDPNIVYMGSDTLFRVDATFANDPYNLSLYQDSNNDGGAIRPLTTGGAQVGDTSIDDVVVADNAASGLLAVDPNTRLNSRAPMTFLQQLDPTLRANPRKKWNFTNLVRNPYSPFTTDTRLDTFNVATFLNTGADVVRLSPSVERSRANPNLQRGEGALDYDWVAQIITTVDPLTGKARVLFGSDEGIGTFVSERTGRLNEVNGFNQPDSNLTLDRDFQVEGKRNGDLQIARLYSGDVQPSLLAASISQSLLYGAARRELDVGASDQDIISTGQVIWGDDQRGARANYVATDQTGSGTFYILRRINDDGTLVDFFQVSQNGLPPISRTLGLFRNAADAQGTGQWDNSVRRFTVNPIDKNGILLGSAEGRVYRTTDMGLHWFAVAEPGVLDGTYTTALTFGAPLPNTTALNDFMYAGTKGGKIFVTTLGGGSTWQDISAGLDGAEIQKIVTNPTRGSHEAYAVTSTGVFYMADWTAAGATWVDITFNLKTIETLGFGNTSWSSPLLTAPNQTPQILTIAVDWRPIYGGLLNQKPILYVGGDAGVFRTVYNGDATNWTRYTGTANGAETEGGQLPVVKVTDLDLALGNIDPNSGRVIPAGAPDALVATTLGRGTWAIPIPKPQGFSGPKVISSTVDVLPPAPPPGPQFDDVSFVTVTFDSFITPTSFTPADVIVLGPNGQPAVDSNGDPITVTVTDITTAPPGQPNLHNVWRLDFVVNGVVPSALTADGTYTIKIGPNILSGSTPMDQDGDANNGEPTEDQFVMKVVIGRNDLADFVRDTYQKLLNRPPTTAEFTGTTVTNMTTARFAGLGVVVKELLSTFNSSEARQALVKRLFNNGGAAGEIGNLLPTYDPVAGGDVTFYVNALKNGTRSPELIMGDIIATTDTTKGFYQQYFNAAGGNTNDGFLNQLYADLFKGTGIQFSWLPAATQATQRNQVATTTGRLTLTRSLIAGTAVKYFPGGNTTLPLSTTDFRKHMIELTYNQLLNRTPTAAEITAGKSLMARPLAAASLNGSEWLYWKLLSSQEYFNFAPTQNEGTLPDNGLHTDRAWVNAVLNARMYRLSTTLERDQYSQKVLDRFKTQRAAFVSSLVNGTAYRDLQITSYFQFVHGRNPTDTERANAQTALANGSTYQSLIASRFATAEFYNTNAPAIVGGGTATNKTWARAVYIKLFNENRPESDPKIVALASQGGSVATRQPAVLALLNGQQYRDILITNRFNLLLGRVPLGPELVAYENFLKTHRWEGLIVDILANGAANPIVTGGLPREFWEIAN